MLSAVFCVELFCGNENCGWSCLVFSSHLLSREVSFLLKSALLSVVSYRAISRVVSRPAVFSNAYLELMWKLNFYILFFEFC